MLRAEGTQSTLATRLGALLGLPVLHLDYILWNPGWVQTETIEFRARVRAFTDEASSGWIIDGNCTSKLGNLVDAAATDIICTNVGSFSEVIVTR
jgi:adenylate kinase family enzyme